MDKIQTICKKIEKTAIPRSKRALVSMDEEEGLDPTEEAEALAAEVAIPADSPIKQKDYEFKFMQPKIKYGEYAGDFRK